MTEQKLLPGLLYAFLLTLVASWTAVVWFLLSAEMTGQALAGAVSMVIGVGLVGWLALTRVQPPRARRLGTRGFSVRFLPPLVLLVPLLLVALEIQAIVRALFATPPLRGAHAWNPGMVSVDSPSALLGTGLVFVLLVPGIIEWFFRGFMHQGLVERYGTVRGTLAGAACYTLFILSLTWPKDLSPHWEARWAATIVTAAVWGLGLGLLRAVSGSWVASALLHALANLSWVALLALHDRLPVAAVSAPGRHVAWFVTAPAVLSVGAGIALLAREARTGR